jgi:hypothetical protein
MSDSDGGRTSDEAAIWSSQSRAAREDRAATGGVVHPAGRNCPRLRALVTFRVSGPSAPTGRAQRASAAFDARVHEEAIERDIGTVALEPVDLELVLEEREPGAVGAYK